MLSRFLPEDFNPDKPIALIAGRGLYPVMVAERIRAAGLECKVIGFDGETSPDFVKTFPQGCAEVIKVGQLGKMLRILGRFNAGYAIMAGQIAPRRLFRGLHPDLKAALLLAKLKIRNAETIFGTLAEEIEKIGVRLLDARCFLDDELATEGVMSGKIRAKQPYIDHGVNIAKEMARLDVGQGVVVRKGTVIAVEAFEGTDAMLRRAGQFDATECIFIKTVKPKQDYRFDVPVFGMKTVEVMMDSNISYAGLEAGRTIILEKEKVLLEAKRRKITIFGYTHEDDV